MKTSWIKKYSLDWPAPLHVLLLAAFPVLFLYAYNIAQMQFGQALLPLAICVAGAFLLWVLLTWLLRDSRKAGLATALFLLFFLSYGRLYQSLEAWGVLVPGHAYLLPGVLLIWGYCVYFISLVKRDFRTTTSVLNIIAVVLIIINLANISIYEITKPQLSVREHVKSTDNVTTVIGDIQTLPDIYFIILDEYAHPDTMLEYYDYDNSQFIKNLESKGFFVANESKTRSPYTPQAIAQVLNMEYLTGGWEWDGTKKDYVETTSTEFDHPGDPPWSEATYHRLAYNKVADFLKANGYKYIAFGNWVTSNRWDSYMKDNADLYFNYYEATDATWISEFQETLWNTTMMRPFYPHLVGAQYETSWRRQTLSVLEHLKTIPDVAGPKFVYAHILCPHSAHVFGPKGESIETVNWYNFKDRKFYSGQYNFISTEIEKVVDTLLKKSKVPPLIILQSDHGLRPHHLGIVMGGDEWHKILNALYMPGLDEGVLYDSISPVNTFRLLFKHYFGVDYETLPDN